MDFICPVCSVITDSSETAQATIDSHITPTDSTHITPITDSHITPITDPTHTATPSAVSDAHSDVAFGLPSFSEMPPPSFLWNGTIEGSDFVDRVTAAYDEVVHWRRNLFVVPFGKVGKEFVQELARLFRSYGEKSALECIALKAAMLCCTLLLQKPHPTASSKDFINCLQRRLSLWKEGKIEDLLLEGCTV